MCDRDLGSGICHAKRRSLGRSQGVTYQLEVMSIYDLHKIAMFRLLRRLFHVKQQEKQLCKSCSVSCRLCDQTVENCRLLGLVHRRRYISGSASRETFVAIYSIIGTVGVIWTGLI
jgi:hypothetical protein